MLVFFILLLFTFYISRTYIHYHTLILSYTKLGGLHKNNLSTLRSRDTTYLHLILLILCSKWDILVEMDISPTLPYHSPILALNREGSQRFFRVQDGEQCKFNKKNWGIGAGTPSFSFPAPLPVPTSIFIIK